jgi:16S rRNA (adenine(1408)-N(1))-methyltransferase
MARARAEPGTLVLGIDANAAGMADSASRVARKPRRGGLVNVRFAVSAVEALPPGLRCAADLVTIQLPWAALLRGLVQGDPAVIQPIVGLLRPGAELRLLLSVTERDAGNGLGNLDAEAIDRLTRALEAHGLHAVDCRLATPADVAASGSTWARRLGIANGERPAWHLRFAAARR